MQKMQKFVKQYWLAVEFVIALPLAVWRSSILCKN